MKDFCFRGETGVSEKKIPSSPYRRLTYDLLVTSLDALPPSYRRPVDVESINYFHVIATNNLSATSRREMSKVDILFNPPWRLIYFKQVFLDGGES